MNFDSCSHCWDGGVQCEGNDEQEGEEAADGEGAEEEGGVVLDLLQPGLARLLLLPLRDGVHDSDRGRLFQTKRCIPLILSEHSVELVASNWPDRL